MKEIVRKNGSFGMIRIMERLGDGARLYCIGESVQTMAYSDGTSLFGYVHAIKLLLGDAKDVLMLGGGGGSLATMLARRGATVTVVDVDPAAEGLARRYFGLDSRVAWITGDARAFLKACTNEFDAVVFDTCDANGFVDSFATLSTVFSTLPVLRPDGSIIFNLAKTDGIPDSDQAWQLASAVAASGLGAALFRPFLGEEINELLHVRPRGPAEVIAVGDVTKRPSEVRPYLVSLRSLVPRSIRPADDSSQKTL